jgi:poly-gamma-glutamate capsule biosynthesis protein CapA/YwtB (metallophosphatase superfamily)
VHRFQAQHSKVTVRSRRRVLQLLGSACVGARVLAAVPKSSRRTHGITVNLLSDCILTTPLPQDDSEFTRLLSILKGADATIANFEGTLTDPDAWANVIDPHGVPICGGQNVRGVETTTADLNWLGIKLVGNANNHAMDWGAAGLAATARKLTSAGIAHAGTGADLAEARRPAYLHLDQSTIALISCASTYWPGALASHSNSAIPGRPGVSPVRVQKNVDKPDGEGGVDPRDLREIVASVQEARSNADIVIISCHTHEGEGDDREKPPFFLMQLARACIDAGAHAFFSHGPHVLRGVELYKGRPIFYSLGSFLFLTHDPRSLPEEMYENCDMSSRNPFDYYRMADKEFDGDTEFWQGAVAKVVFSEGQLAGIDLIPTVLRNAEGEPWGLPRLATPKECTEILRRIERLSQHWSTRFDIRDRVGHVRI